MTQRTNKNSKKISLMLKVFPSKWCVGFSSLFHSFFRFLLFFCTHFLSPNSVLFFIPYPQSNSPRYCSWIQTTFFSLFFYLHFHEIISFFFLLLFHAENIFLLLCFCCNWLCSAFFYICVISFKFSLWLSFLMM